MKNVLIVIFTILILTASLAYAGNQWTSKYDEVWEISVTDCGGNTTIYENCRIVNDGLYTVTFMPNQGRISSENGRIIKVIRSQCTEVIMTAN